MVFGDFEQNYKILKAIKVSLKSTRERATNTHAGVTVQCWHRGDTGHKCLGKRKAVLFYKVQSVASDGLRTTALFYCHSLRETYFAGET